MLFSSISNKKHGFLREEDKEQLIENPFAVKRNSNVTRRKEIVQSEKVNKLLTNLNKKMVHTICDLEYASYLQTNEFIVLIYDNDNKYSLKIFDETSTYITHDLLQTIADEPYVAKLQVNISDNISQVEKDYTLFKKKSANLFKELNKDDIYDYLGSILVKINDDGTQYIDKIFLNNTPDLDYCEDKVEIRYLPENTPLSSNVKMDISGNYYIEKSVGLEYKSQEMKLKDISESMNYILATVSDLIFNPKYKIKLFNENHLKEVQEMVNLIVENKVTSDNIKQLKTEHYFLEKIYKVNRKKFNMVIDSFLISRA